MKEYVGFPKVGQVKLDDNLSPHH